MAGQRYVGLAPTQVSTWTGDGNIRWEGEGVWGVWSEPEWLYCLKDTQPGDRQVVWTGVSGDGLTELVEFHGDVRPRLGRGLYAGWARVTWLPRPVSPRELSRHRDLSEHIGWPRRGLYELAREAVVALEKLVGPFPPPTSFEFCPPDWNQLNWDGQWAFKSPLIPEAAVEAAAQEFFGDFGFASRPETQFPLSNGRRPDLWCPEGVVGDAKNVVRADWGPRQIADYIKQCDRQFPAERPWRGVLIQGEPRLTPGGEQAIREGGLRDRIEVWRMWDDDGNYDPRRLFPSTTEGQRFEPGSRPARPKPKYDEEGRAMYDFEEIAKRLGDRKPVDLDANERYDAARLNYYNALVAASDAMAIAAESAALAGLSDKDIELIETQVPRDDEDEDE